MPLKTDAYFSTTRCEIPKVDLVVESAKSITDSAGFISKEDFMRFAKDKKLTDLDESKDKDDTPKKEWAPAKTTNTPVTNKQDQ
jgi:hypothetical protein